jgi:hypothetical protein
MSGRQQDLLTFARDTTEKFNSIQVGAAHSRPRNIGRHDLKTDSGIGYMPRVGETSTLE